MPSQPDGPSYQKNVYVVIEMMKRAADHAARGILQLVLTSTLIGCATVMAGDLVKKPVSRDTFSDPALAEFSLEQPVLPGNPMGGPVTEYLGDQTEYLGDQTEYLGDQNCSSCGTAGCDPMSGCSRGLWGNVDYLLWWTKGSPMPPLVTTSTPTPNRENAGVLGFDRTQIVFGGEDVDDNPLSGIRTTLGTWLNASHTLGVGGRYFTLADTEANFSGSNDNFQFLSRPFFNVITDEQDALLLVYPNDLVGGVDVNLTGSVYGWEAFFRKLYRTGCNHRLDFLAGYRHLKLEEELTINDRFRFIDPNDVNFGRQEFDNDFFGTSNTFHGADLGIIGESQEGCWSLDFALKVALGNMRQIANISGSHVIQVPGVADQTGTGGLLTQPSNIGRFENDQFVWIPEANVNLGYAMTPNVDVTVGYTFIYISDVMTTGAQIDPAVNLTQRIGAPIGDPLPQFPGRQEDFWLQGLNFGLTWRY